MDEEAPVGHVVHLVRAFDESGVPSRIGFGTRLSRTARLVIWMLVALAAAGTAFLVIMLWRDDSPWWFDVIFTVMPSFFVFGCGFALWESGRLSRREQRLAERWALMRDRAAPTGGQVSDRQVSLAENGGVSAFTLTVESDAGTSIRARWHRSNPDHRDATLLQTQIPAIGSRVRIWGVGMPDDDAPVIVQALDASVMA
ncbi:hypothetical protein [Microbacterium aurantiacum]|uniref:hypothetical protein n=1 Tax=Microbacterium aurantiacum TaxID=162393 RepID=UPI0011AF6A21|nr:hypothetical protein [Microbacterium aurantiacum]